MRGILAAAVLAAMGAAPAAAFHVCAPLADTTPVAPRAYADPGPALKAREKLERAAERGHTLPPGQTKKALAEAYGAAARAICRDNPDACGAVLVSSTVRDAYAADAPGCIPEALDVEGTLARVLALQPPATPGAPPSAIETWFLLPRGNRAPYRLSVATPLLGAALRDGHKVRVRGRRLVNDLFVVGQGDEITSAGAPPSVAYADRPFGSGPYRVTFVAATFADSPSNWPDDAALVAELDKVRDYVAKASHGRFALEFRTVHVTVAGTAPPDPFAAVQRVVDAAPGATDWEWPDVISVVTDGGTFPFGGVSNVGLWATLRLPDGRVRGRLGVNLSRDRAALYVWIHEMLHALGLLHAGEWLDLAVLFPETDWAAPGLVAEEYGNGWSVMGQGIGPVGCHGARALDWLAPGEYLVAPPPGVYELTAFSRPGLRCLFFPIGERLEAAVQYRLPILTPWDDLGVREPAGAYLTTSGAFGLRDDLRRLQGRPDARWRVGDRIEAPATGLALELLEERPDAIVVRVVAVGTPDAVAPSVLMQWPPTGGVLAGLVDVHGTAADANLARVDCSVTDAAGRKVRCGDVSGAATWRVGFDSTTVPDGAATVLVTAWDRVGNGSQHSARVTVANGTPPPPSLALQVVASPPSPASMLEPFPITARCYDGTATRPCERLFAQAQYQTNGPLALYANATGETVTLPAPGRAGVANVFVQGTAPVGGAMLTTPQAVLRVTFVDPAPTTTTTAPPTTTTTRPPTTTTTAPPATTTTRPPTTTTTAPPPTTTTRPPTTTTTTLGRVYRRKLRRGCRYYGACDWRPPVQGCPADTGCGAVP